MKKCLSCSKEIPDQYIYCLDCSQKAKETQSKDSNKDLIKELGKLNNNLYFLRFSISIMLREFVHKKVVWDKSLKDFIEVDLDAEKNL